MVLAARLIVVQILIFFACICSCRADDRSISDLANIKGYTLQLASNANHCTLLALKGGVQQLFDLSLRPPCYFSRRGGTAPQYYSYPQQGISAVILVVGSPISESDRQKWNLEKNQVCADQRQAIFMGASNITMSKNMLEGGITCKDTGSDEKDFAFFALHAKNLSKRK